jgi:hypothetical protein
MIYENFLMLKARVQHFVKRKRVAVVAAEEEHTLEAVCHARRENIVEPVFESVIPKKLQISGAVWRIRGAEAIVHNADPLERRVP